MRILSLIFIGVLICGSTGAPSEEATPAPPTRSPFVKRVLKLTRALRAFITLDPELEEEMRSAALARAKTTTRPEVSRAEERPGVTWFGLLPKMSPQNAWFQMTDLFKNGNKDTPESPVLLPINPPVTEDVAEAPSNIKPVVNKPQPETRAKKPSRDRTEMPNPDATGWFGMPEESKEDQPINEDSVWKAEIPSPSDRWNGFHDGSLAEPAFGDFGEQFSDGTIAVPEDNYDSGLHLPEHANHGVTRYGKPVVNDRVPYKWARKSLTQTVIKKKSPTSHKLPQAPSESDNQIDTGEDFASRNNILQPPRDFPVPF